MQAHIQHQLAPALVLAVLRTEPAHQFAQHRELLFGQFALLGLVMAEHVAQALVEFDHLRQTAVAQFDGQQGAAVERHLLQAGIDLVQALGDGLARLGGMPLQGQQVVLALALQQLEEARLVPRQAVAFQALQAREEILGAAQAEGEIAAVFGPLLAVAAEAAEQQLLQAVVFLVAGAGLLDDGIADLAKMRLEIVQAQHAQASEARVQPLPLQRRDHARLRVGAGQPLLFQPRPFDAEGDPLFAHAIESALGLLDVRARMVDRLAQRTQVRIALA